ncbi:cytochrome P460 family protein [Sphingomonas endolithica]|uniref:cytochrome P460 family protein n=1 Tax=Sphingomonas endolithica TaxID=2972485 RepID=UPI0021AF9D79|nr:cytochrome P460 family protein [Sphingomonas sp. ZFBP2030]
MFTFYGRFAAGAAVVMLFGAIAIADGLPEKNVSPVFGVELPAGYRQWQVISVAHEAGNLNDIRINLGNDIAIKAFRNGQRPFPDGTMIARVAWKLVPSARNNAIFGRPQSFVAGDPTNVQISVKNARRYAATGGWGYGQFENGKANQDAALMQTCFACHAKLLASDDFVFTSYSR